MTGPSSHLFAVAVGVYDHDDDLPELAPAAERLVSELSRRSWTADHPEPLEGRVEPDRVADQLRAWLDERSGDDRAVLYWTGHGRIEPWGHFLVTSNSPPRGSQLNGDGDAYDPKVLARRAFNSRASHTLLIIDTCYSGSALDSVAAEWSKLRATTTGPTGTDHAVAIMTSAHALDTVPEAAFCNALTDLLTADLDPSHNDRLWDDADPVPR